MDGNDAVRVTARRGDVDVPEADRQVAGAGMQAVDAVGFRAHRRQGRVADVEMDRPFSVMRGKDSAGFRPVRMHGHVADADVDVAGAFAVAVDGPGTLARRRDAAAQDLHAERP